MAEGSGSRRRGGAASSFRASARPCRKQVRTAAAAPIAGRWSRHIAGEPALRSLGTTRPVLDRAAAV